MDLLVQKPGKIPINPYIYTYVYIHIQIHKPSKNSSTEVTSPLNPRIHRWWRQVPVLQHCQPRGGEFVVQLGWRHAVLVALLRSAGWCRVVTEMCGTFENDGHLRNCVGKYFKCNGKNRG